MDYRMLVPALAVRGFAWAFAACLASFAWAQALPPSTAPAQSPVAISPPPRASGKGGPVPAIPAAEASNKEAAGPQIRGMIRSVREATLSAEILAKIIDLPFEEGQAFAKGDVLVRFDCARYRADLAAAEAEHAARAKTYENTAKLGELEAASQVQVEVAREEMAKAKAIADSAAAIVGKCVIVAPWSGRVVEIISHKHETVSPGKELLRIVDDGMLEVTMMAPSHWLRYIKIGDPFHIVVDETGRRHAGRIKHIGARVDAASQTVRLTGKLEFRRGELLPGMSGTVYFDAIPSDGQ